MLVTQNEFADWTSRATRHATSVSEVIRSTMRHAELVTSAVAKHEVA